MKSTMFLFAVVIVLLSAGFTSAINPIKSSKVSVSENTVESLLMGIESDNLGLKTSAAYMLGELNSQKAVIPLLKMLHSDKCEEARLAAALALYKIGSEIGLYAVRQAVKFDESQRVQKICGLLYNEYQKNELNDFTQIASLK